MGNTVMPTVQMMGMHTIIAACQVVRRRRVIRTIPAVCRADAADCISGLIANGFIEDSDERYKLTLKGNALSIARCTHRINKEKADKIFSDLIQRVHEINNDDTYLHKVSKLFLFGSYSDPSKEDFGDIDIAFKLRRKIGNPDEFMEANDKWQHKKMGSGFIPTWINSSIQKILFC